jgi:hypothetical protein
MNTHFKLITLFMLIPAAAGWIAQEEEKTPVFQVVDFEKIERKIANEPAYVANPLYALFLFGPKAEARVWAVLDKSKPELDYYDTLYLDKDADGDLTDTGEKFTGQYNERGARAGIAMTIKAGDLPVPGTDRVHRDLKFSTIAKTGRKGIWFTMLWCGKEVISGGATRTGMDSTCWAPSPGQAPILRPTAEGPLSFAIWGGPAKPILKISASTRLSFMIGNRGSGTDTLCYVSDKFLIPSKDRIFATVIAKDQKGRTIETRSEIRDEPC